jgi:mannose-6-phosphate isomerase-like protein (cupin superfamily)
METLALTMPANRQLESNTLVRPSLDWLINPLSKDEYLRDYWEKRPLVVRREQPDYFSSLLSFEDVDRVITTLDRRYPDISLKNANDPGMSASDYALASGALDVAKLYQLFEQGATVTLAFLDTVLPGLTLFCRSLESEFSCPMQTNVYMTPPGAQGAKPHYDTHDVFVLQVSGSKRWTIFGTPMELPLPGQTFDEDVHELGAATSEFELHAGDLAYIPRGVAHEAKSTDTVSLHITTGILRYTWADLLIESVAAVSVKSRAFREALPPGYARSGFDRIQARETMRTLLREAADRSDFDAVLDGFVERFLGRCPPVLDGQMEQLRALDSLTVNSAAGAREGVVYRLEADSSTEIIETYGRRISFPSRAGQAVRFALSHMRFAVRDLPGNLDDEGKITLVQRLIREGLVRGFPD